MFRLAVFHRVCDIVILHRFPDFRSGAIIFRPDKKLLLRNVQALVEVLFGSGFPVRFAFSQVYLLRHNNELFSVDGVLFDKLLKENLVNVGHCHFQKVGHGCTRYSAEVLRAFLRVGLSSAAGCGSGTSLSASACSTISRVSSSGSP